MSTSVKFQEYTHPCAGDKCLNNPCCEDGLNYNKAVAEEPTTVPDLRGTPVGVGDTIAYAATDGRSSGLRIGKVIEIVWTHEKVSTHWTGTVPTKLRVEVEVSSGYGTPSKPVLIEAGFKRFAKLG